MCTPYTGSKTDSGEEHIRTLINVGHSEDLKIRKLAEAVANAVGSTRAIEWDRTKPDGTALRLVDSLRMQRLR